MRCGLAESALLAPGRVADGGQGPGGETAGSHRNAPLHPVLNWCLLMPRLAIFDSSVCRGIASFAAAPAGPEIRPRLSASAALIISLSRSGAGRPSAISGTLA